MAGTSSEETPLLKNASAPTSHQAVLASATQATAPGLAPETGQPSIVLSQHAEQGIDNPEDEPLSSDYLGDYTKARFWTIFVGILAGYFVAMFDSTLMASSHPVITSYFHASNAASWLSTAFMLTSTALQPLFGRLSDIFGRRPVYLFSLAVFACTTAWCGLAQSIGSFIAARAVSGLGAGGVQSLGAIMTNDLVRIEVRGTYQAYINLAFGLGSACGAAFGGFFCDTLGWRWTFGIQVPAILLNLVTAAFATPRDLGPQLAKQTDGRWWHSLKDLDVMGSLTLTCASSSLILALNLGGNVLPWSHPIVITSFIVSVAALILLYFVERRAKRPVMPLQMLFSMPRGSLVFSNFFSTIGINTIIFNAPLYFQAVKQNSPSVSGFRLAGPSALLTVCAVGTGMFITRTGRMKIPQVIGGISMLVGAVCLTAIWEDIPVALATLFVIPPSMGQGFMFPATTVSVLAVSTQADQAVMTTTLGLWRNFGIVLGVAISSLILQNSLVAYLQQFITGEDKAEIILRIRQSVSAVKDLDPVHRVEAIRSYSAALRLVFAFAIGVFVIVNILIAPVDLPHLGHDRLVANDDLDDDH